MTEANQNEAQADTANETTTQAQDAAQQAPADQGGATDGAQTETGATDADNGSAKDAADGDNGSMGDPVPEPQPVDTRPLYVQEDRLPTVEEIRAEIQDDRIEAIILDALIDTRKRMTTLEAKLKHFL